jgi:hypothetical protein
MTVRLKETVRNAGLDQITTDIGTSGFLRIYDGTQPASVATAISGQTLLAELPLSSTAANAASGGVWTANAITDEASALATGTQTWATLTTSAAAPGVRVVDMSCGSGSGDLSLSGTITASGTVSVTALTITDNNA